MHEVLPVVLLDSDDSDLPFGWIPDLADSHSHADMWLRAYLWECVGGASDSTTLEDLSDGLMDALDEVPSNFRCRVVSLSTKIRKHHGLDVDDRVNSRADQVDRYVVDFATYNRLLAALEDNCSTSRQPERQARMRLLIVLAFRFGMRRREMLLLRRGDVDLPGEGRIHIRPYVGHTLKTGFSRRSLPIVPLLNDQERQWLVDAVQASGLSHQTDTSTALLFPEQEHDTLARDAIALLRRVGDDDRLKLHHLRHSFASWMAMKIVFARKPEWAEVFAGHPEIFQEMLCSPVLVGAILKPKLSAGDFLIIPRMLGHSSYEVSLTNYVHTLDLVSTLFVNHQLSDLIVPKRDLGHLVNRRFQDAVQLRKASVAGYAHATHAGAKDANDDVSAKPWSTQVKDALLTMKRSSCGEMTTAVTCESFPISQQKLQNWHSPRHALGLRDRLLAGIDRLDADDLALLVKLCQIYWRDDPPMFWFSQRQINSVQRKAAGESVANTSAPTLAHVQQDLTDLLRTLRQMGLTNDEVYFWRYKQAREDEHKKIWGEMVSAHGFETRLQTLSGSSTSVDSLGVSLGMNSAKRSPLPGIVCEALAHILG